MAAHSYQGITFNFGQVFVHRIASRYLMLRKRDRETIRIQTDCELDSFIFALCRRHKEGDSL